MQGTFSSRRSRKINHGLLAAGVAGVCIAAAPGAAKAAILFQDNFTNGSTLNGTSTPSGGNSTSYDIASSKNQSPASSIAANDLKFGLAASTSAVEEAQAVWTTSPVVLNVGETLDYQVTFTNTGLLLSGASASSQISFGLYSSGGTPPITGLNNSLGLANTQTNAATGGTQLWDGYTVQYFAPTGKNKIVTRPQQSGATQTNTDQDLIGNNASASSTYANPAGAAVQTSSPTGSNLVTATQYFNDMSISLTSAGTYEILSNLYQGSSSAGTFITSTEADGVTALNFFSSLDSLAIGYRQTTSAVSELDVSLITISLNTAPLPEPASIGLLALGGSALLARRRRK